MDASEVAARYQRFAETEARERSPLYAAISRGVAADREVLDEKRLERLRLAADRFSRKIDLELLLRGGTMA
jgi:hypothetical protein